MKKLIITLQLVIIFVLGVKVLDLVLKKEERVECEKIRGWIIEGATINPTIPEWCK